MGRKTRISQLIIALSLAAMTAYASYNDVVVVVNVNSSTSMAIGDYFKRARAIPSKNLVYVNTSTAEEIDSVAFQALRDQIEAYLTSNNLVNTINYIVTTKGVPLKVNRGNTFSTSSPSASVESELACILGSFSSGIGQAGRLMSPYYYGNTHFSRAAYGMYLVTRLDGYTLQDVYTLIDKSGPGIAVPPSAAFVMDEDPAWNASLPYLNNNMANAKALLEAKGKTVRLNTDTAYVTNMTGVVGYASWGSNDHYASEYSANAIPNNTWAPGGIAETYVSTSGRSFENPPSYGQSLIADLIAEGASGAKGYVYEPYSSAMANVSILFDRYSSGYNLAESYSMSSCFLSWMDVVIGDPKTSVIASMPQDIPLPIQLSRFDAQFNAGTHRVDLSWSTLSETDNYGFYIQRSTMQTTGFADLADSVLAGHGTTSVPQTYTWQDRAVSSGQYYYRIRQVDLDGTPHVSDPILVDARGTMDVEKTSAPSGFRLDQNFPNPFNPTTTIGYSLEKAGKVTLKVYTELGQLVTTLVDEAQSPGPHSVVFSSTGVARSSGAYFYTLQTERHTVTRKMALVK